MESKMKDFPQAGPGTTGESRPLAEASGCRADYGGGNLPLVYDDSCTEEHEEMAVSTKRKRDKHPTGLDYSILDLADSDEMQKLKRALNKTPTKKAQETLTTIEAKVGEQLSGCMANVRDILNKSLEELEKQKAANGSASESASEDFLSPLSNWDMPGAARSEETQGETSASSGPAQERRTRAGILEKMQSLVKLNSGTVAKKRQDKGGDCHGESSSTGKNRVEESISGIEQHIKTLSAATTKWRSGKLVFRVEDLAQCSESITNIQLELAAIQKEHGALLRQYQLQVAENRNLSLRLKNVEDRLDRSEDTRGELKKMWAVINDHVAVSKPGETTRGEAPKRPPTGRAKRTRGGINTTITQNRAAGITTENASSSGSEVDMETDDKPSHSYAKAAARKPSKTSAPAKQPQQARKERVWQTPPNHRKKLEVIVDKTIGPNPMAGTKDLLKKGNIRGLANIRLTRNGDVAVVCTDAAQRDAVSKVCEEHRIQKRTVGSDWPMLRLLNCEKGISEIQLSKELADDATIIEVMATYKLKSIMERVVTRKPTRREDQENVVVQLHPAVFKALVRRGRVNIGLISSRVEEYLDIPVCYKCSQFGHKAQKCENNPLCIRCGGSHEGRDCKSEDVKCPTCTRANKGNTQHTARSMACPFVRKAAADARRLITYSDG